MPGEKFLAAVAKYYHDADIDLSELCLVFPNKRAAIFFRRYFKNSAKGLTFIPDIKTIGALNETFSDRRIADHIELIFILYKAYCNVLTRKGNTPKEFSKFAFWGEMILSDFDDIDAEMADAKSLFTNVVRYNEISSDYLTDEQRKVIRAIWGNEVSAYIQPGNNDRFWRHIPDADNADKPSTKFLHLWEILDPLYQEFNKILDEKELTYPGRLAREVTEAIIATPQDKLPFKRIGFVGFNRVNLSLAKLMDAMQSRGMADFFWDLLPAEKKYCDRAGLQIAQLAKHFPMPWSAAQEPKYNIDNCSISVYAIPSNTLQAKVAGNIINVWNNSTDEDGKRLIETSRPDNTAIILPDASLLSPVLAALPPKLGDVNITMGLSYRETPFASMMRSIISMHMRCRYLHGKPHYFYEDIATIIAHPSLRAIALKACLTIKAHLDKHHLYNVPVDDLYDIIDNSDDNVDNQYAPGAKALKCILQDVKEITNPTKIQAYLSNMISALRDALIASVPNLNENAHEIKVIDAYQDAITRVFEYISTYRVSAVSQGSIFSILDRLLSLYTFNMSGTPLSGLQVMGVLETRAIDFENVVILSMNERVYPKRNRQRSLISQQIRRAYHLPAADTSEQEYSYYFFRLFSRSKRVVCLYDSRANGAGNGAVSRYLLQMNYLNGGKTLYHDAIELTAQSGEPREIIVPKDDKVMAELSAFKSTAGDKLNLSASALKKYRACKLEFYLQYVKRVRDENEPTAYMDSATYGTVMHNVLQQLFIDERPSENPVEISKNVLIKMKSSDILGKVKQQISELYHDNKYNNRLDHMPTESLILAEIMADFIRYILDKEISTVETTGRPFYFVDAEERYIGTWAATPKNSINFRMDIDRHDIMHDGIHRFVDYKTGSDSPKISSISSLFSPDNTKANDACLQLLTYAAAYSDINHIKYDIKPSLYQLRYAAQKDSEFYNDGDRLRISDPNSKVDPVIWRNTNPEPWQKEFREELEKMIDEIFDKSIPFTQTEFIENCRYCKFIQMCARVVPEKDF